jgi:uncharacterized protein
VILYLDTSALVKLFAEEPGSALVRDAVAQAEFRACHLVGYVEACATIARRCRQLAVPQAELDGRIGELTRAWARLDVVQVDWPLVHRAGQLAVWFGLRGFDSVHLAAAEALWVQTDRAAPFRFAVFDRALSEAARALGLDLLEG